MDLADPGTCYKKKIQLGNEYLIFSTVSKWRVLVGAKRMAPTSCPANRRFSKKALARIENFLLFYVPMNPLKAWNAKLEAASFFSVWNPIQAVWCFVLLWWQFWQKSRKLTFPNGPCYSRLQNRRTIPNIRIFSWILLGEIAFRHDFLTIY